MFVSSLQLACSDQWLRFHWRNTICDGDVLLRLGLDSSNMSIVSHQNVLEYLNTDYEARSLRRLNFEN